VTIREAPHAPAVSRSSGSTVVRDGVVLLAAVAAVRRAVRPLVVTVTGPVLVLHVRRPTVPWQTERTA
jgi:hypothetical protein